MNPVPVKRRGEWFFAVLMVGGFLAAGIYTGMTRAEGAGGGNALRAAAFFAFGLLMLWRVLGTRRGKGP